MKQLQSNWAFGVSLLAIVALVGGCGVSSSEEAVPGFELSALDTAGGLLEAGDVTLFLPQNALTEPTQISILPQAEPFPILPENDDPCTYTNDVFPPWCIGPVGHPLEEDSLVILRFDPALLPPNFDLANLVLLEWDNSVEALRPNFNAVLNTDEFYFQNDKYRELGHIQVGIRECPPGGIVFNAFDFAQGQDDEQVVLPTAQVFGDEGLYVLDVDVDTTASFVETESNVNPPTRFIFTQDEQRIIYDDFQIEDALVKTVVPQPLLTPETVAGPPLNIDPFDPFLGGLREPAGKDVFFRHFISGAGVQSGQGGGLDLLALSRVPSLFPQPEVTTYDTPAFDIQLIDMRQSEDGQHALLLLDDFADELQGPGAFLTIGNRIVIVNIPGASVVSDGVIPTGGGLFTPRFMPDGTGVYVINDAQTEVIRYDLDGSNPTTIWDPTLPPSRKILDFWVFPDGVNCVALLTDSSAFDESGEDRDYVYVGEIGNPGTVLHTQTQGRLYEYNETFLHPAGSTNFNPGFPTYYVDRFTTLFGRQVVPYSVTPAGILRWLPLPALSMDKLDFNRKDGRLLHVVGRNLTIFFQDLQSGKGLQDELNEILEFDSIQINNDQTGDQIFELVSEDATAAVIIELGLEFIPQDSTHEFGIYEYGDPDNRATIFAAPETVGSTKVIKIKPNGFVVIVNEDESETVIGNGFQEQCFGFFLVNQVSGQVFFSEHGRNPGWVQMLSFRGDGTDNIDIDQNGSFETPFGVNDFILAWEDRDTNLSDRLFQDFVVYVSNLTPSSECEPFVSNIWITDPIGRDPVQVPMPEGLSAEHARWRASVRTAPGMDDPARVR